MGFGGSWSLSWGRWREPGRVERTEDRDGFHGIMCMLSKAFA